jgi:putative transposase
MAIQRRKFSEADKLGILESAEKKGVTTVLREHRLSYSVFVRWKHKYGQTGNKTGARALNNRATPELRHLAEENGRLKEIIADQALELVRKEEELRRYNPQYGKR